MPASPVIVNSGVALNAFATTLTTSVNLVEDGDTVFLWAGSDSGQIITGVTTAGLTWSLRKGITTSGSGNNNAACSLWWTTIPIGSGITDVVALATFSGEYDASGGIAFNVRGWASTGPFDNNMVLPLGWSGNPPGTEDYSTNQNDDLLIYCRGGEAVDPLGGVPAGWTKENFVANSGGFGFFGGVLAYRSVSAPQSAIPFNDDTNSSGFSCFLIDAVTSDIVTGSSQRPFLIRPSR